MTPISFETIAQAVHLNANRVQVDTTTDTIAQDTRVRRFFGFGQAGVVNAAIKADTTRTAQAIKSALKEHFGAKVGTTIFNRYIGEKALQGKNIASSQLRALVEDTTRLEAAHSASVIKLRMQALSMAQPLLSEADQLTKLGLNPQRFAHQTSRAASCLEQNAFNPDDVANVLQDIAVSRTQLQDMRNSLVGNTSQEGIAVTGDLDSLLQNLDAREQTLRAQMANNPASIGNMRQAFQQQYMAAIQVIDAQQMERANRGEDPDPALAALKNTYSTAIRDSFPNRQDTELVAEQDMKLFRNLPAKLVKDVCRALPGSSKSTVGKALKAAHTAVLNQQGWPMVTRDISLTAFGLTKVATSAITPAQHIGTLGNAMHAHGLNGVSCEDRGQANHAVNLAQTTLTVPDATGQPKTLFQGLRHAVNCAYSLNPPARRTANEVRTKELFIAALEGKPHLLAQARGGRVVELPIISTSLMTPDAFRGTERTYLEEQTAAWESACDNQGLCQIPVSDGNGGTMMVTVRPKVVTFSFGVNAGAQTTGLRHLAGGWGTSEPMNERALGTLVGDPVSGQPGGMVATFLRTCSDPTLRLQVERLTEQIKLLWNSGSYKTPGEDPYRLPARIAVLTHLMGMTPAFNCKSGKDRTGQMDVACKTLAFQVSHGSVPSIEGRPTADEHRIFQQFAVNSGNLEFQRINTGLAGFKTQGVAGLDALFDSEARKLHRGMSTFITA